MFLYNIYHGVGRMRFSGACLACCAAMGTRVLQISDAWRAMVVRGEWRGLDIGAMFRVSAHLPPAQRWMVRSRLCQRRIENSAYHVPAFLEQ